PEFTLGELGVQFFLLKQFQDLPKVFFMFLLTFGVDQNVIDEDNYKLVQIRCSASSFILDGANLYGARATGVAPGTKSIRNSTYRVGGIPASPSGKTSEILEQLLSHLQCPSDFSYVVSMTFRPKCDLFHEFRCELMASCIVFGLVAITLSWIMSGKPPTYFSTWSISFGNIRSHISARSWKRWHSVSSMSIAWAASGVVVLTWEFHHVRAFPCRALLEPVPKVWLMHSPFILVLHHVAASAVVTPSLIIAMNLGRW
ncbi:hypothetical protein Tco_0553405, partial [Tanacetum coccineum]